MRKFKVGDRVECVDDTGGAADNKLCKGVTYEIGSVDHDGDVYLTKWPRQVFLKKRFILAAEKAAPVIVYMARGATRYSRPYDTLEAAKEAVLELALANETYEFFQLFPLESCTVKQTMELIPE